jgi:hypothetical protein
MNDSKISAAELKGLYEAKPVARAFFDLAARRERDQSETKVDRLLFLLRANDHNYDRSEVIELFRALEQLGCGSFVAGRRGWPSRFVWSAPIIEVARAAVGLPGNDVVVEVGSDIPPESNDSSDSDGDSPEDDGEETVDSGTGLEEEETGTGEINEPFDPAKIRVETKPMVISLLLDRIRNNEIDLTPGFQRKGGIWSQKAKSQLIESLLIRIPLPAFYMDGGDESHWLVVDGLQRLSTLKSFVLDRSLRLAGMEFLKDYNGHTFDRLPRSLQRRILETQVTVFLIQENTPPEVKFNIFKRINTGGMPLSTQEIRHALHQGPAADLLKELAESTEFKEATNYGIRDDRMGDRECVLRLLSFMTFSYRDYKSSDLDSFLNERMEILNKQSEHDLASLSQRVRRCLLNCYRVFGDRAFRKQERNSRRRLPINRALFEVWASCVEALPQIQLETLVAKKSEVHERFIELLDDSEFKASISFSTGDPRRVRLRFARIERLIQETIDDSPTQAS